MLSPYLPQEILLEIFSRLPAESVGVCRCLSRSWFTRLSSPNFIKAHLDISKTRQRNIFLVAPKSLHVINTNQKNATSTELDLPHSWTEVEMVGSCDGVVMLLTEEQDLVLINPITLHNVRVPRSPHAMVGPGVFNFHGFGFDAFHDDYKIVTLSRFDTSYDYALDCFDTFVDVYSARSRVWKRIENSPFNHPDNELSPGAFVNGALHWMAKSWEPGHPFIIASFNLTDEVFTEIPIPDSVDKTDSVFGPLTMLGKCLCMVHYVSAAEVDVWMMKEYGFGDSWIKFSIEFDCVWDFFEPLCYTGEDEVVLLTQAKHLVLYNLKKRTCRRMVVDGAPSRFIDGSTFVGSLVSPYAM